MWLYQLQQVTYTITCTIYLVVVSGRWRIEDGLQGYRSMGTATTNPKASSPACTPCFHHEQCPRLVLGCWAPGPLSSLAQGFCPPPPKNTFSAAIPCTPSPALLTKLTYPLSEPLCISGRSSRARCTAVCQCTPRWGMLAVPRGRVGWFADR